MAKTMAKILAIILVTLASLHIYIYISCAAAISSGKLHVQVEDRLCDLSAELQINIQRQICRVAGHMGSHGYIYDHIWPGMAKYMTIYGHIWTYIWPYMAIYVIYGHIRSLNLPTMNYAHVQSSCAMVGSFKSPQLRPS